MLWCCALFQKCYGFVPFFKSTPAVLSCTSGCRDCLSFVMAPTTRSARVPAVAAQSYNSPTPYRQPVPAYGTHAGIALGQVLWVRACVGSVGCVTRAFVGAHQTVGALRCALGRWRCALGGRCVRGVELTVFIFHSHTIQSINTHKLPLLAFAKVVATCVARGTSVGVHKRLCVQVAVRRGSCVQNTMLQRCTHMPSCRPYNSKGSSFPHAWPRRCELHVPTPSKHTHTRPAHHARLHPHPPITHSPRACRGSAAC